MEKIICPSCSNGFLRGSLNGVTNDQHPKFNVKCTGTACDYHTETQIIYTIDPILKDGIKYFPVSLPQ